MLYGDGNWLNYDATFSIIIYACTLQVSDVFSLNNSIVLQSLLSWPTDLKKLQYKFFSNVRYFCIIGQWYGSCPVSYRSRTIVFLLVMDLAFLLPCTMGMLDICSYGVLLSYMWYTKWLLFCLYPCSSLFKMLSS